LQISAVEGSPELQRLRGHLPRKLQTLQKWPATFVRNLWLAGSRPHLWSFGLHSSQSWNATRFWKSTSAIAGARNHLQADRPLEFRFEIVI